MASKFLQATGIPAPLPAIEAEGVGAAHHFGWVAAGAGLNHEFRVLLVG